MARNLILSGGVSHDFAATSQRLAEILAEVGVDSEITEDLDDALSERTEVDLVTINAMRWTMADGHFPSQRQRWEYHLPADARAVLLDHLERGGGLLAMHSASICFDDWQGWSRVIGGCWKWGKSFHPPIGWISVRVRGSHPVVDGLRDFDVVDEVYSDLVVLPDVTPLATSQGQPMLWARPVRRGRVVYDALGHDVRSYDSPVHRTLLQRAALWSLRQPVMVQDER